MKSFSLIVYPRKLKGHRIYVETECYNSVIMNRFKVGDKVYSKKGYSGEELGTVAQVKPDGTIVVRQFSNNLKEEYDPKEIYNQQEHDRLNGEQWSQLPKNDRNWGI